MAKRALTKDEFVEKAVKVHGDRYDYSESEYVNNRTKISIICKVHGVFWQTPTSHLSGSGCHACTSPVFDTKSFISQSDKVHKCRYDYSLVDYISATDKVKIVCREHGMFQQIPCDHSQGHGCAACSSTLKHTTSTFTTKALEVHGNKYDYSLV